MRHGSDSGYSSLGSASAFSRSSLKHEFQLDGAERSQLPSPLEYPSEIESTSHEEPETYRTRSGRFVIPQPVAETLAQKLKARATSNYVDLPAFAKDENIELESLERLIEANARADFPRVIIDVDAHSYLCSDNFADEIKGTIVEAVDGVGTGISDLTAIFGHLIPPQIIIALATEATANLHGEVHLAGDHVIWTRSCSSCCSNHGVENSATERIDDIVSKLTDEGFIILPETEHEGGCSTGDVGLEEAVVAAYRKSHPHDAQPQVVYTIPYHAIAEMPAPKAKVLVKPRILNDELSSMKLAVTHRAELMWNDDSTSAAPYDVVLALEPDDFHAPHKDELSSILVRSDFIEELEGVAQKRTIELEKHRYDEFTSLVETRLWCPLHLYAAGIIEVDDTVLKRDLGDYAVERFRRENIPETIAAIRRQNVSHNDDRAAAIDRLELGSQRVGSFSELQAIVAEAATDLQVDKPHEDMVLQVKHRSLDRAVEAMQDMTRGLDVLQNLIWVLLATSGPGLFVGSVKYTSKMITQYEIVGGDPEVSGMLSIWWDKVRDGLFDPEDLRQMRELARGAVEVWREEKW